jgi:hypothetical protein
MSTISCTSNKIHLGTNVYEGEIPLITICSLMNEIHITGPVLLLKRELGSEARV